MIMDRIGQHEALLPINQNYNKISVTNWTLVIHFHNIIKCKTTKHMQMKHCVHLHGHDMLTVPLTVLLHHPITSMTGDCPISAQIRLVITNQV